MKKLASFILCALISISFSFAQSDQPDPLARPGLWEKLVQSPSNLLLWADYIGKPLDSLQLPDAKNILLWSKSMEESSKVLLGNPQLWEAIADENPEAFDDLKDKAEAFSFQHTLGNKPNQFQPDYGILTNDIEGNFVIIEDILRQKFMEMGIDYESYVETYPKNNYSKIGWMDDKEKELENLQTFSLVLLKARTGL